MMDNKDKFKVVYLSMEIALENNIRTYAGGLGMLAGDILKSAADLQVPLFGVTLLNREGYFKQVITSTGEQEEYADSPYDFSQLKKLPEKIIVAIGTEKVTVAVWRYIITGRTGFQLPVYLLDTKISTNSRKFQDLTGSLYGGDTEYRLFQEIILGRAGIKLIKTLDYKNIGKVHINEGHGSLATVELFLDCLEKRDKDKVIAVKKKCVFTTHTPIKATFDKFPLTTILKYQPDFPKQLPGLLNHRQMNTTKLALYFSGYVNSVALSHQLICSKIFPHYTIHNITNGVHSLTWTAPEFKALYDKHIPNWRHSSFSLRNAFIIPLAEVWQAHQKTKQKLINYVYQEQKIRLETNVFTIGYARRFTPYKRPELLFKDVNRLLNIHRKTGKIQIVYAGKAHPRDEKGKELIKFIYKVKEKYKADIKIVFLEGYDMKLAKLMTAGVDLWLNMPLPPNEASGTSGMKAAHNGVPQLSTYDGWWCEGYIKNKTGWTIRGNKEPKKVGCLDQRDAKSLYDLLEQEIIPKYYHSPSEWQKIMRFSIAVNASFFNTERVVLQYIQEAYL